MTTACDDPTDLGSSIFPAYLNLLSGLRFIVCKSIEIMMSSLILNYQRTLTCDQTSTIEREEIKYVRTSLSSQFPQGGRRSIYPGSHSFDCLSTFHCEFEPEVACREHAITTTTTSQAQAASTRPPGHNQRSFRSCEHS